ncbi:MAG: nuclease [Colwellia sp.]|jgi:Zn finger protein HypA/HybF involved in hydrogenase expression|nr:MAG: nuclease [Colwellia sp.]
MILKDKELQNVKAANTIAGQKQEQDIAFYLRREFKNHPKVFVINDYKFSFNDETAQIDHLIVYPYGFILIESKSITGEVTVNEFGEWSRSSKAKWSGMPSPIKQIELQQKLLREFLYHHREKILNKLFGIKQQSFGKRCWNNLCAISSNSIINRESIPKNISDVVVKSEFLIDKINEVMKLEKSFFEKVIITDTRPDFNDEELQSITNFLIDNGYKKTIKNETKKLEKVKTNNTVLKCKKCNEASNYTAQNGRYGYFINCNECNTNTPMKMPCNQCHSKNTKVSKKKEKYTLNCSDCDNKLAII